MIPVLAESPLAAFAADRKAWIFFQDLAPLPNCFLSDLLSWRNNREDLRLGHCPIRVTIFWSVVSLLITTLEIEHVEDCIRMGCWDATWLSG